MFSRLAEVLWIIGRFCWLLVRPAGLRERHWIYLAFPDAYASLTAGHAVWLSASIDGRPVLRTCLRNGDRADTGADYVSQERDGVRCLRIERTGRCPSATAVRIELKFVRETGGAGQSIQQTTVAGQFVLTQRVRGERGAWGPEKKMKWNLASPPGGVTEFTLQRRDDGGFPSSIGHEWTTLCTVQVRFTGTTRCPSSQGEEEATYQLVRTRL